MRRDAGPSVPDWEQRGWLRLAYISHYSDDLDFVAALNDLKSRHLATLRRTTSYDGADAFESDARALATQVGLDRMSDGGDMIESWCRNAVRSESTGRKTWPFTSEAGFGGAVGEPTVAITTTFRWDPATESPKDARNRLKAEAADAVQRTIDAGAAAVPAQGHVFLHKRPELQRDITSLFWRVRHGWDWTRISEEWDAHHGTTLSADGREDAIERQVRRLAELIGLNARGLNVSQRRQGH